MPTCSAFSASASMDSTRATPMLAGTRPTFISPTSKGILREVESTLGPAGEEGGAGATRVTRGASPARSRRRRGADRAAPAPGRGSRRSVARRALVAVHRQRGALAFRRALEHPPRQQQLPEHALDARRGRRRAPHPLPDARRRFGSRRGSGGRRRAAPARAPRVRRRSGPDGAGLLHGALRVGGPRTRPPRVLCHGQLRLARPIPADAPAPLGGRVRRDGLTGRPIPSHVPARAGGRLLLGGVRAGAAQGREARRLRPSRRSPAARRGLVAPGAPPSLGVGGAPRAPLRPPPAASLPDNLAPP